MAIANQARQVECNDFVTHHLIDHRSARRQNLSRRNEEALHERDEFSRAHLRRKLCRSTNVGIDDCKLYLSAASALSEQPLALVAVLRIAPPWSPPDRSHQRSGNPVEGRQAEVAPFARSGGDQPK